MATSFEDFTGVTQRQQGPVARRVGVTGRARETVGRETTIIDPGDPSPDVIPFGPAGAIRERRVEGTPDRFVRGAGPPAPATARTRDGRIVPAAGPPTPAGTFTPGRPGGTVTDVVPARYYQGDEYTIYTQLSKEQRAAYKQIMRDYGLLPKGGGGRGAEWDSSAFSAFREVLTLSNANGVSYRVQISSLREQAAAAPPGEGATLPARVINVSNPDDLKTVFRAVAQEKLGRNIDEDTLNRYVQVFQGLESGAQNARFDATYAPGETGVGPGGTITGAPSPDVFAESQLRQDFGTEFQATDIANQLGTFLDIIGGA